MRPDGATADLLLLQGALIGVLLLAVAVVWWMDGKIENGCPSCAHCLARRRQREDDQRAAQEEYERRFGLRPMDDDEEGRPPPRKD